MFAESPQTPSDTTTGGSDTIDTRLSGENTVDVADDGTTPSTTEYPEGRLDVLVREVEALRGVLSFMESRQESFSRLDMAEQGLGDEGMTMTDPPACRLTPAMVARMRQQNSTLRGAPMSQIQASDRTYRLQPIEGIEGQEEIEQTEPTETITQ